SAVTDADGRFTLKCAWGDQDGAAVATHRVVVRDPPTPEELRGQGMADQRARYEKKLVNRPIPEKYGSMGSTPVRVEGKPGQKEDTVGVTRDRGRAPSRKGRSAPETPRSTASRRAS